MEQTVATGMDAVTTALTTVTTLVGNVFDMITSNPLLVVFVAAGLVGTAIGIFKRLRSASQGR